MPSARLTLPRSVRLYSFLRRVIPHEPEGREECSGEQSNPQPEERIAPPVVERKPYGQGKADELPGGECRAEQSTASPRWVSNQWAAIIDVIAGPSPPAPTGMRMPTVR